MSVSPPISQIILALDGFQPDVGHEVLPTTIWSSISVRRAITSDVRQEERRLRQESSFEVRCALSQVLPPVSIIFVEQISSQQT